MNKKFIFPVYMISGVFLLLCGWFGLSLLFSSSIVPFPWDVGLHIVTLLPDPDLLRDIAITAMRSLAGFLGALILGTGIGICTGINRKMEKTLFFPMIILQGAPPLLWIVPLVLILGTKGAAPGAVVFFIVLPIVSINIQEQVKSISSHKWDMMRIYAPGKKMLLTRLIFPELSPSYKTIIKIGMVIAFKSCLIGEWFGAADGMGRRINEYFYSFNMVAFYAYALIFLALLGSITLLSSLLTDRLFTRKISTIPMVSPVTVKNGSRNRLHQSIQIHNLSFSYMDKTILDKVDFYTDNTHTAIITGDSGVGKTTFAKLAAGLLTPGTGTIHIPPHTCLMFQEDIFLSHLDCYGNASLPGVWKNEITSAARSLYYLELCGLSDSLHLFPDQLSGGMKKRLSLARALVYDPDFLIIDEPFTGLHKQARMDFWDLALNILREMKIPVIIITHHPEEIKNENLIVYRIENRTIKIV
ncbi:MAG: ATP-binding cassette domain-containing protein [Spirochaetales bacterium]|nr:ATP-binding cassette domain-containing protein [Spirochaetales bacterium]